jgi:hypothetical protein
MCASVSARRMSPRRRRHGYDGARLQEDIAFPVAASRARPVFASLHGRPGCRPLPKFAHVSVVYSGYLTTSPRDRDRIPAHFSDNAAISGVALPINASAHLEGPGFVDCHWCSYPGRLSWRPGPSSWGPGQRCYGCACVQVHIRLQQRHQTSA